MVKVSVVAAKEQIWQQGWPSPKLCPTVKAAGAISEESFAAHGESLRQASVAKRESVVILDGMQIHTVFRRDRQCAMEISENAARNSSYAKFAGDAVVSAWRAVTDAQVRNALRFVGGYVGLSLPEEALPAPKPTIRTVILGPTDVAAQLLESLRRHHEG